MNNPTPAAMVSRPALAAGLLLLGGLAACGGADVSAEPAPQASQAPSSSTAASTPPTPSGQDSAGEPIEPGKHRIARSAWSSVPFAVTFPEGWSVQYGHVYHQTEQRGETAEFYAVDLDEIYSDSCRGEGTAKRVGPDVGDLVAALREQKGGGVASRPIETTVGGYPATRVEMTIPQGLALDKCRLADDGVLGLQLWYNAPADKYFVLQKDGRASIYVVDVGGDRQVFLTQQFSPTPEESAEVQAVIDSIRIG